MQKNLFYFVFIIVVSSKSIVSQNYSVADIEPAEFIVTYSLTYKPDSLQPDFKRQEDQIVLIGNSVSLYLSRNAYYFEMNTRNLSLGADLQDYLYTRPAMPHNLIRIYKNLPMGKLTYTDYVSPNRFKFEEPLNLFDWKLAGDTDTV